MQLVYKFYNWAYSLVINNNYSELILTHTNINFSVRKCRSKVRIKSYCLYLFKH